MFVSFRLTHVLILLCYNASYFPPNFLYIQDVSLAVPRQYILTKVLKYAAKSPSKSRFFLSIDTILAIQLTKLRYLKQKEIRQIFSQEREEMY
jgi:hypothetical protein